MAMVLAVALGAQAPDDEPRRGSEYRGPGLGVARISLTDGDVRILRPSGDDFEAHAGMPLVRGDRLVTGSKSRAEIQFDGGNYGRLSAETEVRMTELGNKRFKVDLIRGLLGFSQFRGFEADVDVQTTLAAVRPIKASVFAVEHHGIGETDVAVRDGSVEVFSDEGIEKVKSGLLIVRGEPNDVTLRTAQAEPKSGFDDWNKRRDKLLERDGRASWQRWAPSYVGLGVGYGRGWGYGGFGPGFYRSNIFFRTAPRGGHGRSRRLRH
jgi:hypothetical protein